MRDRNRTERRTTHYPAWYRVRFLTVAGWSWIDVPTIEEARRIARRERGEVLACWEVAGSRAIDSEPVS